MCGSIKVLFPFDPPATDDEIRKAALQFVRKISGQHKPTKQNEEVHARAVEEIFVASKKLIDNMKSSGALKNREVEAQKLKEKQKLRFQKIAEAPRSPSPLNPSR